MIRLSITGRIGKDAEVRTLTSGDMAISFNVCHSEKYKDKDGVAKEIAHWVACTKWVKAGQSTKIADFLKKGQSVLVEGVPSARAWVKDGSTDAASSLECRVSNIELIGSAPQAAAPAAPGGTPQPNTQPQNWDKPVDDDLPF